MAGLSLASPVAGAAATLKVNTTRDALVPGRGTCSLREAIEAVDVPSRRTTCGAVGRRSNVIVLAPGRYTLSIPPVGPDDNTTGDLNVTTPTVLTITGTGVRGAVIDGRSLGDRVLSVASGASVTLAGLTITGGHAPAAPSGTSGATGVGCTAGGDGADGLDAAGTGNGGGISSSGMLVLQMVTVAGNSAGAGGAGGAGASGCHSGNGGQGGNGGGIYSQGRLSVIASTITDNRSGTGGAGGQGTNALPLPATDGAGGQGGLGGGIYSTSGRVTVTNSTLFGNFAGPGGPGGGLSGGGGGGGNGGGLAVVDGPGVVRNATIAGNGAGAGGSHAPGAGGAGTAGTGGGVFAQSPTAADRISLQNTIVASNLGSGCAGSAIANGGHDLSFGDGSCPGLRANPRLGPLKDNGGPTETIAIGHTSAAVDRIPRRRGGCPSVDQRGVRRPQGRACDIGAFEFARPSISIVTPAPNGSYEHGSRILARFLCDDGGVASAIATCKGSVALGHAIGTGGDGTATFVVTAVDKNGNRARARIHYDVWQYVNPLQRVSALMPRRIDLGVDYGGFGPLLAIGRARVTFASNTDSGPPSCWAISCWPGGGIVVYRLLEGPYAGKYIYVAEHITVNVRAGETVSPGQQIATLYLNYPWSEWGWAAGPGPEAMAMADGHKCSPCSDPGNWSTIEGRTMNHFLVGLGAPSGIFQASPNQSMPAGWPTWPG